MTEADEVFCCNVNIYNSIRPINDNLGNVDAMISN